MTVKHMFLLAAVSVLAMCRSVLASADGQAGSTDAPSGPATCSYTIVFHRMDASDEKTAACAFPYGVKTRLPSLANGLGWARRGYAFKGWATSAANAESGKVWKGDWAYVATPTAKGKSLDAYAVWALKPGCYQMRFDRNDGSGRWRTLAFPYGVRTQLPTLEKGLGWGRGQEYAFRGWATSLANENAGRIWKRDGAWVSTAAAGGATLSAYGVWMQRRGLSEGAAAR